MPNINRRATISGLAIAPLAMALPAYSAMPPFNNLAKMMHDALGRYGVEILPIDDAGSIEGMRIGDPPTNGGSWTQRHVDSTSEQGQKDDPDTFYRRIDALAKNIASSSKRIRFGHLFVPTATLEPRGIVGASRYVFGNVSLRDMHERRSWFGDKGIVREVIFSRIDALFVAEPV